MPNHINKTLRLFRKEEGSALASVLVISVVIFLFIGAILGGIVVQLAFIQRDVANTKAMYIAEAEIFRFLDGMEDKMITRDTTYSVGREEGMSVALTAIQFGGFLKLNAKSKYQGQVQNVEMLIGEKAPEFFEYAVILGDSTSGLNVTGGTTIIGDLLLGEEEVSESNFKGVPFSGKIDGSVEKMAGEVQFPEFNTDSYSAISDYFNNLLSQSMRSKYIKQGRNLKAGHINNKQVQEIEAGEMVFVEGDFSLNSVTPVHMNPEITFVVNGNMTIEGKIQFGAMTTIVVEDTVFIKGGIKGENLIIFSENHVKISGDVAISAQIISDGSIDITGDAYLLYPSVLYSGKEYYDGASQDVIALKDKSILDGTIIYPNKVNRVTQNLFKIAIRDEALVRGAIFSNSQTVPEGSIYGSMITFQSYYYQSPTTYINWLKDVTIDVSQRPENYVVPIGFSKSPKYAILNWFLEEE